jgi:hypothetical protein
MFLLRKMSVPARTRKFEGDNDIVVYPLVKDPLHGRGSARTDRLLTRAAQHEERCEDRD